MYAFVKTHRSIHLIGRTSVWTTPKFLLHFCVNQSSNSYIHRHITFGLNHTLLESWSHVIYNPTTFHSPSSVLFSESRAIVRSDSLKGALL